LPEARTLVIQLNAGALPVPVSIEQERTVDATLGSDSIRKSLVAGQVALVIVALFMILYYRLPGALAGAALLVYTLVTLAIFKLVPVTLTLAGIAAFILSVGMAVDANILIFERMKEELRTGRPLGSAIDAGFGRAWTSIRDSNVSTIITCLLLYWFGSNFGASLIMGFALTLGLGVLVSMFSAIFVTRSLLRAIIGAAWTTNPALLGMEIRSTQPAAAQPAGLRARGVAEP
jgi:preprotein translocase subunit SecD